MKDKNREKNKDKIYFGIIIIVAVIAICTIIATVIITNSNEKNDIAYTELIKKISNQEVEKIEMTTGSTSIKVKLKDDEIEYKSIIPSTQAFIELVQEKVDNEDNGIKLEQKKQSFLVTLPERIFSLLPTIVLIILVILIIKMQGLGEKAKYMEQKQTTIQILLLMM